MEIGHGLICADIFPNNIVKHPTFPLHNEGQFQVSAQLLFSSDQGESVGGETSKETFHQVHQQGNFTPKKLSSKEA